MYHPMCALLSGAQFHISPWSNNVKQMSISCKGHAHKHDKVSMVLVCLLLLFVLHTDKSEDCLLVNSQLMLVYIYVIPL